MVPGTALSRTLLIVAKTKQVIAEGDCNNRVHLYSSRGATRSTRKETYTNEIKALTVHVIQAKYLCEYLN